VSIRCAGDSVSLRIEDPVAARTSARTIDVPRASPFVRARLVALAAAEIVRWSWAEIEAASARGPSQAPRVPHDAGADARRGVAAGEPRGARLAALAVAEARFFASSLGLLPGVGAALRSGGPLALDLDLIVHRGRRRIAAGSVGTTLASAAIALLWSPAPRRASIALGAGVRAGLAHLSATPDPSSGDDLVGHDIRGTWAAPVAIARVELARRALRASAGLELGWIARGYAGTVPDAAPIAVSGGFGALQVAVGLGR
jgi:hypothetical protein